MLRYITSRLGQSLILLVIVSFIGFAVLTLAPGGPLSQFALSPGMTQEQIAKIAAQMGLDRPLPVQYFDWLRHLVVGDWGTSYRDGQPVLAVIGSHLFATLLLMGTATVISVSLGSAIGIASALRRGTAFDYTMAVLAMVALSIPTFWFGLIAIYAFSLQLGWLPAGNMYTVGDGSVLDYLRHLILPAVVLALVDVAVWSRYMRTSTLTVINQDFVRTARAKGLTRRRILFRHIVGNSLVPMVTLAGLQLPTVLGGALVTETVFTWPGMGRLFLDSLGYSDYPVVMGLLMASAILVLLGNLAADLIVALIDPRILLD
ncbi:ABC transporter permease [Pseudooceanicola sp. CBS1P-1]|uniref:ABC transporter permease subunit n=1 Tax=Pseudooceanicola albus TaxID=2692189 RepID=A0A6L7G6N9_9RHOB|nr:MULTISPECIES: ABC transporter permease [Pseudooceanicola]MBT9384298.1 ABC transporter permease [Pseudooceanicola endophyticus]MXN19964.1 ABC transporter permease subunit [Pseudooceanicola albus]